MSKAVGIILTVAVIAFAIAVPVFGIAAATAAIVSAALTAAIAVNALLMPKPKVSRNAQETTIQLGEVARRAIFGEAATGGSLVDAFNYGGKYGTEWEVVIIALADHRCHSLTGFYVNDEYVAFAGDGAVSGYGGQLNVYFRSGTEAQSLPTVVTANGPGWASGSNGAGVCYVVAAYKADKPDDKHPVWPGGRPRFRWIVKGKFCYDPRLDSTVAGGSGAHRWDVPATWAWTDNPIVCRYNWVRGVFACDRIDQADMLLVGRGLSEVEQPPVNVFAPANLCDELVGGQKRYRIGGVIAGDQKYLEAEEMFAAACGGIIIQPEGAVEIEPGQARAPSFFFTDDDLIVGSEVEYNQGMLSDADGEWINTVIPRYVSPAQKWADHAAPVRRSIVEVLADGGAREETVVLQLVTNEAQAGTIGEIHRRLGRLFDRGAVTLGPRFAEIEEGDWGVWTSARRFGGLSKTFRVESFNLDKSWQNRLQLREIHADVYAAATETAGNASPFEPTTPPPDIGAPDVGAWTLTAEALTATTASVPMLVIAGAVEDPDAQAVRFEYWPDDGVIDPVATPDLPDWIGAGTFSPGVVRREIVSIVSGADYYAAVSYLVDGIPGDRRVLGPVTVGMFDVSGQTATMGDMPEVFVDADYTGAITTGELPLTIQGRRFLGAVEVTEDATWAVTIVSGAITITDLTPTAGSIEVTDLDATAQLTVTSTYNGLALSKTQVVTLRLAAPPAGGSNTASDSTFTPINSASMAAISDELTVIVAASGEVTLTAPLTVKTSKTAGDGVFEVFGIWQWWNGSSWADLGTEVASHPDCEVETFTEPTVNVLYPGSLSVPSSKTGLTPAASEKFRLRARNASGTRTMTFVGTATATSS